MAKKDKNVLILETYQKVKDNGATNPLLTKGADDRQLRVDIIDTMYALWDETIGGATNSGNTLKKLEDLLGKKADLGPDGYILPSQVRSVSNTSQYVAASQAAMLAVPAKLGDSVLRTDLVSADYPNGQIFELFGLDPTVASAWIPQISGSSTSTARNSISSTVTALPYNPVTGVISLETGYVIPTQQQLDTYLTASSLNGLATTLYVDNAVNNKFTFPSGGTVNQYINGTGALATFPAIPTTTNDLTNNSGFITSAALNGLATTSYVDTGLGNRYTKSESDARYARTVNNQAPDQNGNITITVGSGGITSFNTRTGDIILTGSDVNTALGYSPVNPTTLVNYNTITQADAKYLKLATSTIYPTKSSYQIPGIDTDFGTNTPLELINLGTTTGADADHQSVNAAIMKVNWALVMTRNVVFDKAAGKFVSKNSNWSSSSVEVGGEGVTLHAVPAGTNFSDTWHELFQVKASGPDSISLGSEYLQVIQSKTSMYWKYKSGTYNNDDSHPWVGGTSRQTSPGAYFHTEEAKSGEWVRFESNMSDNNPPGIGFFASNGTFAAKTAAGVNKVPGKVEWYMYDGSTFQKTSRIYAFAEAAATTNNAPTSFIIETGNSTSAGTNPLSVTFRAYADRYYYSRNVITAPAGNPSNGVFWWFDSFGNMVVKKSDGTSSNLGSSLTKTGSGMYSGQNTYNVTSVQSVGGQNQPIEILNIGSIGSQPAAINSTLTGLVKLNSNMFLTRNMLWDSVNSKWTSPQTATISNSVGLATKGILFQVANAGNGFSDSWNEVMVIKGNGPDGATLDSDYNQLIQPKTTMFFRYDSTLTPADTLPWLGSDAAKKAARPGIWFQSDVLKSGEWLRFEMNGAGAISPGINFSKSTGSYGTAGGLRAAVAQNDSALVLTSSVHDGTAYQNSARIRTLAEAAGATNNAPQSIIFETGNSTSAGTLPLAIRLRVFADGLVKTYGAREHNITAISANTTLGSSHHYVTATGNVTITLPDITNVIGREYIIIKEDATNTVTINAAATQSINGLASRTLTSQYEYIKLLATSTGWRITG